MYRYLIALILLFSASAAVASGPHTRTLQKLYLSQEHVVLHNNQILVGHHDNWVPVSQLLVDANGLYVNAQNSLSPIQWECSVCGFDNWFCGHRR